MVRQTNLHLVCGKVASGKSTFARTLAVKPGVILLEEDVWLSSLFAHEMSTLKDYVRCSERLRLAMIPHIINLLQNDLDVVLDFPANTRENRRWMRDIIQSTRCDHQLHFFDVADDVCKARLRLRNASGKHEFSVTEAEFDRISRYFQPPSDEEGFNLMIHTGE